MLLLTLSLASLTLSFGGLTQKGCAYHMPQYGEIFGRCDIDNSLCSFGCRVRTALLHFRASFILVVFFEYVANNFAGELSSQNFSLTSSL